jgi:hypothetical protein
MACSLRARGADYPTIAATLSGINANRCSPPLEHTEIDGIVKSACRYAPGTAASHVNGEVQAELDTFALAVYGAPWCGKAGKTDRDVLLALVGYARRYGVSIPAGVRLAVSYRDLALDASIGSRTTLSRSIKRCRCARWIRQDNAGRGAKDAGAFVLLPQRPQVDLSTSSGGIANKGTSGPLTDIPRLRHRGVGKKAGHLLDALHMLGGNATVKDVATAMHEPRPDRLRQDYVLPLVANGIADFDATTDTVRPSDGWQQNLEIERGLKGEIKREERQRRHAAERHWFHSSRMESERADG